MKSVDNLREWANALHGVYINQIDHTITVTTGWDSPPDMDSVSLRDHVNGILDGIECENDKMVMKLNAEHLVRQNVERENAKLRELVRDMAAEIRGLGVDFARVGWCDYADRMRELGIEVD